MTIETALRRLEIFSHFTEAHLQQIGPCLTRSRFPDGAAILQQGDTTRDAYLVESGQVRIERKTPYGLYRLASLGAGELFGETSFIDGLERTGTAVAEKETVLLGFNPVTISAVMERDQKLSVAIFWAFWKSLSAKLREANETLTRFFAEADKPAESGDKEPKDPTGEFRIDLAAKRRLFQEQKLSNMEINFLASLSKEKKFAPGKVIFREGDPADEMYLVVDGRVMISKFIPGAGDEALAFLDRGDYFGEMALIDRQPRSADAKADDRGAVVLAIPRDVLERILHIEKPTSLRLLKILCSLVAKRLREVDDKIVGWYILASTGGRSLDAPRRQV